jgi:hypothetical protein
VTAKEKLVERVSGLSEEEAAEALRLLFLDDETEWPDFPPAPPEIVELARRVIASPHRPFLTDEEFGRKHGLDD